MTIRIYPLLAESHCTYTCTSQCLLCYTHMYMDGLAACAGGSGVAARLTMIARAPLRLPLQQELPPALLEHVPQVGQLSHVELSQPYKFLAVQGVRLLFRPHTGVSARGRSRLETIPLPSHNVEIRNVNNVDMDILC